jgi:hypothetical protein
VRFNIGVGGAQSAFATKFPTPFLSLVTDPSVYDVALIGGGSDTIWDGAPLSTTFDMLVMTADQDCDIEFTVDGGEADEYHFTLFLRGGGFPLIIPGDEVYAGQTGTQDAFTNGTVKKITKIRALNRNAAVAAVVSVLIGKAA